MALLRLVFHIVCGAALVMAVHETATPPSAVEVSSAAANEEFADAAAGSTKCDSQYNAAAASARLEADAETTSMMDITEVEVAEADAMTSLLGRNASYYSGHNCMSEEYALFVKRYGLPGDVTPTTDCDKTAHLDFQFHPEGVCSTKNVLFLYPEEDDTNAFCVNRNVCHRFLEWSKYACSVTMRRIDSIAEALVELARFPDDSIKHIVLGGHGSGSQLHFGSPPYVCGKSHLCVNDASSNDFLVKLSRKMQAHGSIFTDSCLSATSDPSLMTNGVNLAQWVASTVGKGLRVLGSEVSFKKVMVNNFKNWHAEIPDRRARVQHVYVASGATCPDWSASSAPDDEGNCACKAGMSCTTLEGDCPKSGGERSAVKFIPGCAESWAENPCECA